jgi:hypothetical protein
MVLFPMKTALTSVAWVFVLAVATYDASFAWNHRTSFEIWEMNPVAVWAARLFGLGAVLLAKFLTLVFATWVAAYCHQRRHRLEMPYTFLVGSLHFALSLHYYLG